MLFAKTTNKISAFSKSILSPILRIGHTRKENPISRQSLERLATLLRDEGAAIWLADPRRVAEGIEKTEQSWALKREADTAIQLGVMYDLVNRHQDALDIYRDAFHRYPNHPRLRHEAGVKLLRHGQPKDVNDFFASILQVDAADIFAQFVSQMLAAYSSWVADLATAIQAVPTQKSIYILSCAVWGEPFATNFVHYLCATLLSPNNLPNLARRHSVHFVIFTTSEIEARLKYDPLFTQLSSYASIHFIHYGSSWIQYKETMLDHYGSSLGPYYARTCKFLLFSCAHYVALAAGREIDGLVVPLCADMVLNDGALSETAKIIEHDADIVAFHGIRLGGQIAREKIEANFKSGDGRISISTKQFSRLLVDHTAEAYFVDSKKFTSVPEFLCWRVGENALLVHGTHYHPICIRPSALALPFALTIDPVDSRFLNKRFFDKKRIHFVRDTSIACLSLEEVSGFEHEPVNPSAISIENVSRWLWQVWSPWRKIQFALPLCIASGPLPPEWQRIQKHANTMVDEIINFVEDLEATNHSRYSWILK